MCQTTDKYRTGFIYLLLIVLPFAVFWQVHAFDFTNYDDNVYVTENQHIITGFTLDNILWAFTSSHDFMWHPMTSLSHMLDCQLFGLKPCGHHLTNLVIHIANTLLLFEILRRMTKRVWPSAFVAAVFAVHPLNVESVAWISERKNVLSSFFWLLTIAVYIRYAKYPCIANYLLVVFVFSLALMSKPTTVTLPFVLLLLDYWPLDRFRWMNESKQLNELDSQAVVYKKLSLWQLVKEKIPLLILSVILCIITTIAQKRGGSLESNAEVSFGFRLANALVSYVNYIAKMIYPSSLAVFYPHPGVTLPVWKSAVSLLALTAVSVEAIRLGRRRHYLTAGWLWYLGTLVPVIGLIQSGGQAMADRYTYIPFIGLFIIVAWGTTELLQSWRHKRIALAALSAAVILLLSVCTYVQAGYWRDSISLFSHAIKVTHGNHIAYNNRGTGYFEKGEFDAAIADYDKAIELNPQYTEAYSNRGNTLALGQGKFELAIADCNKALSINPKYSKAYNYRANAYKRLGRFDLAIADYNKALEINPRNAETYGNRGNAYAYGQNRFDLAIADYNKALEIDPHLTGIYFNKALACERTGLKKEAIEAYEAFIRHASDPRQTQQIEYAKQRLMQLAQ